MVRKRSLRSLMATVVALSCGGPFSLGANNDRFCPALIHPGDRGTGLLLILFPIVGPKQTVTLPHGLPSSITVNKFSTDGRAIYVQPAGYGQLDGIIKIEFRPVRKNVVLGSAGFGTIWSLTVLRSGLILVSGNSKTRGECGTFEIDPAVGTSRSLLAGRFPGCGSGGGAISPDGTRVLGYSRENLTIIDLRDQTIKAIDGIPGRASHSDVTWPHLATWSPDGKWISVTPTSGDIVLIDTSDTSRRRNLGPTDGPPAVWSPDSKHLLLSKSESRCSQYQYFQSLESIEVATGKRQMVRSSRCEVGPGWFGWLDLEAIR